MYLVWSCILIVFCLQNYVLGLSKVYCDLDDSECVSKGAPETYKNAIIGTNTNASSDPLCVDVIELDTESITFKLTDAKLSGLKNCNVTKLKIVQSKQAYVAVTLCKRITIDADYEIKGHIIEDFVEGKGMFKSVHDDYQISYVGDYEKIVDNAGITHMYVTNHTVELEPKGEVQYELKKLFNGDELKAKPLHGKWSADNWEALENVIALPTMRVFVKMLYGNVNKYLATVPIEELYFYYA